MNETAMLSSAPLARDAGPVDVDALVAGFGARTARIGVIGLGYVGLPLAATAAERGFTALGFDIDRDQGRAC